MTEVKFQFDKKSLVIYTKIFQCLVSQNSLVPEFFLHFFSRILSLFECQEVEQKCRNQTISRDWIK